MSSTISIYQGEQRTGSFHQRLVASRLFWAIFMVIAFSYPVYRSMNRELPPPLPVIFEIPAFQLTNEFGKPFGSKDLEGRPYIASFLFTNCPTSCIEIVKVLKTSQKRLKGLGTSVGMLTFTVDPQNDTPEVLFKYARDHRANPHVWNFVTGTSAEVEKVVVGSFKLIMGDKETKADVYDIAHSEKLVLVDGRGRVRGLYGIDKFESDRLMIDLGLLINRPEENKI